MEKSIDYLVKNDIIIPLVQIIRKDENSIETEMMMLERIFKCKKYRVPRYAWLAKATLFATNMIFTNMSQEERYYFNL
jgi:hypothetical protein